MKAKYICFEGTEGCYKTTNTAWLAQYLQGRGNTVLQTKEPGTPHIPLTNVLRGIMLDSQYDSQLEGKAREFISQAIRSIHVSKLIKPAINKYDYIVQDRGILSGIAYGTACGNNEGDLIALANFVLEDENGLGSSQEETWNIYDLIIFLKGDTASGLATAKSSKQEFEAGDAMEAKGLSFMQEVENNFTRLMKNMDNVVVIDVVGKSREEIQQAILTAVAQV